MAYIGLKQLDPILTGSLQVSGSARITGSIEVSGNISGSVTSTGSFGKVRIPEVGNLNVEGNALFGEYIYHRGDLDTYIQFDTDEINFVAGAANMIYLNEGGAGDQEDKVTINTDLADVDFQVKGDNEANLIRTVATTDRVGIGTSVPSQILTVAGNVSSSGHLNIDGHITGSNISASGDITGSNLYSSGRIFEQGSSVIDHATAMAIVFGG
jgi:cytoskeletal protein CcmA (bactofilin family)